MSWSSLVNWHRVQWIGEASGKKQVALLNYRWCGLPLKVPPSVLGSATWVSAVTALTWSYDPVQVGNEEEIKKPTSEKSCTLNSCLLKDLGEIIKHRM